jgi:hypothetical protein
MFHFVAQLGLNLVAVEKDLCCSLAGRLARNTTASAECLATYRQSSKCRAQAELA